MTDSRKKQKLNHFWSGLFHKPLEFSKPATQQAFDAWEHEIIRIHFASTNALEIHVAIENAVSNDVLIQIEEMLEDALGVSEIALCLHCHEKLLEEKNFLCSFLPWISTRLFGQRIPLFTLLLPEIQCSSNSSTIVLQLPNALQNTFTKENAKEVEAFYRKRLGVEIGITIQNTKENFAPSDFHNFREQAFHSLEIQAKQEESFNTSHEIERSLNAFGEPIHTSKKEQEKKEEHNANQKNKNNGQKKEYYKRKQSPDLIYGYMDDRLSVTPIDQLDAESSLVSVYGEVKSLESKLTSNDTRALVKFAIYGKKGAIFCVLFLNDPEKVDPLFKELKSSKYIQADIEVSYDAKYTKDLQGKVIGIKKAEAPEKRKDLALEKRVELHIHTNMSAQDGHSKPSDLIELADHFGMPAVAVTDHGIVQAFPEAQAKIDALRAKGSNLKVIFGTEGYLMDDGEGEFAYGLDDLNIEDRFVAIDLETTGLNPSEDRIIEMAAVRFEKNENGHFVPNDRFQCFVKAGIPLPEKTIELTGITEKDMENALEREDALQKLHAFLGDDPIVGHNVFFDLSFIRYEAYKLTEAEDAKLKFNPTVVDTLNMSKSLHKDWKRYSLDQVAKQLQIPLESHHRALDDAICSGMIFNKLWAEESYANLRNLNEKHGQKDKEFLKNFKNKPYHIILLAKDLIGLYNLYRLVSISHIDYFKGKPRIPRSILKYFREGLIVGSACEAGEILRRIMSIYTECKGDMEKAKETVLNDSKLLKTAKFYDYLEVQPLANNRFLLDKENNYIDTEEDLINLNLLVIALGDHVKRDVVATCDSHFLEEEDAIYRKILMVANGFDAQENPTNLYFRTTDEMLDEFHYLPYDLRYKIVVTNTRKIADMVDPNVRPFPKGSFPPHIASASDDVEKMTWDRCKELYEVDGKIPEMIYERVEKELRSIIDNGFGIMYYISAKLVKKTNDDGYIVGSRGSVGSSVVAFLCGISEVNPLPPHYVCPSCHYSEFAPEGKYGSGFDLEEKNCPHCGTSLHRDGQDIPFETFLGFNGDKQPDIDLNFSGEYQAKAHQYIVEMFGESHTYRAGTISGYAEKNALGIVLKYAEKAEIFLTRAESVRLADGIVGIKKTTGQHPGGIVVIPKDREIFDFTPIQNPADKESASMNTTHFDFNSMHDTILKLDILGHDDPTMLKVMSDMTGVKIEDIPIPDKKVMALFQGTEAIGIPADKSPSKSASLGLPEMGTLMARDMIQETKPTQFFDLVQLMGLSHGTDVWQGNAQDLIRSGTCSINEVIGCRDGIMTSLINWGLESKMAFDIMEKVRKGKGLTPEQESAMHENNVPEWYIDSCKKIKYMFPKAHAAAYVISSLRVAYFKVYYPAAYYAAYFSVRADEFDYSMMCQSPEKVTKLKDNLRSDFYNLNAREKSIYYILELVEEMYLRGIRFAKVDIEKSGSHRFQVISDKEILPSLNTLPSISTAMADQIVEARESGGPFPNHEELRRRAKLGQSAIDAMVEQGVLEHIPASAQMSLFDMI